MQKIFLFDVDGVILKSSNLLEKITKKYGVDFAITEDFFKQELKKCLIGQADLKERINLWFNSLDKPPDIDGFLKFCLDGDFDIDQNVLNLVKKLNENHLCFLATNQEKYRTEFLRQSLQVGQNFIDIFSSCELGCAKPDSDFFLLVKKKLNDRFNFTNEPEMYFIDDRLPNIEEAFRHGIDSFHYKDFVSLIDWLKGRNLAIDL